MVLDSPFTFCLVKHREKLMLHQKFLKPFFVPLLVNPENTTNF